MSRVKLWAGLIMLFGAGALTGVMGTCLYHEQERTHRGERGPAPQHEWSMKQLTYELSLTATQQGDIEPVVTRAHVAILELRLAALPGFTGLCGSEEKSDHTAVIGPLACRGRTSRTLWQPPSIFRLC